MTSGTSGVSQIAVDILRIAKSSGLLSKFYADSLAKPIVTGQSHQDRVRVLNTLFEEGCITTEGDVLVLIPGNVPDWILSAVSSGFLESQEVEDLLIESPDAKKKFDLELLTQIGLKGEMDFINWLKDTYIGVGIRHVSLFDDTLGYDVEAEFPGGRKAFFEIKSSTRVRSQFNFFISKNELDVAKQRKENWRIACMSIENGESKVLGLLSFEDLEESLPLNRSSSIIWQSLSCKVDLGALHRFQDSLSSHSS